MAKKYANSKKGLCLYFVKSRKIGKIVKAPWNGGFMHGYSMGGRHGM